MSDTIKKLRSLALKLHHLGDGQLVNDASDVMVVAAIEIEKLRANLATQQNCCDGAAAQDAHVRQEREEHRAEVEGLRAENERLREALRWYANPRNHFHVERRSPGDPDPAVIFIEEPPIMSDGGHRARNVLEGKP